MKYLFSENGLKILESFCFTTTLFAFDFDGTLAKIVSVPANAKMGRETTKLLHTLNQRTPIAIISGRGIADLKPRIGFEPRYLVGNHGLEGTTAGPFDEDELKKICQSWKEQTLHLLPKTLFTNGVEIEDKVFSLAIHYRSSRNKKTAKALISTAVQSITPSPRVIFGKAVFNIVPAGGPHKGVALMELMKQAGSRSAFYIGDDDTDEDVFNLHDSRVMTVRVGNKRSSQARYFIERQAEVNRLLKNLIHFKESSYS
jgi:trehalose 6-phosphate phosphatase